MVEMLKAVLVGCGGISRAWFRAHKNIPGLHVVGLVDIRRDAAQERAAEFALTDAIIDTDLAAVLDRTQPDMVFNCTTPEAHRDVTLAALEHGCHLLSEKPLADSMDSARQMSLILSPK